MFVRAALATLIIALFEPASAAQLRQTSEPQEKLKWDVFPSTTAFLLMSSTVQRKVSYVLVSDFKAANPKVRALVDDGLAWPYGLAYDPLSSVLYVADAGLRSILCFKIQVRPCQHPCPGEFELDVQGARATVVHNVLASWVAVDNEGNLFYTDQETRAVNRLDRKVLWQLREGAISAADLRKITESELKVAEAVSEAMDKPVKRWNPSAASVLSLHQAAESAGGPSGVAAEGGELYWADDAGALNRGSAEEAGDGLQMAALGGKGYGVTATSNMVLMTSENQDIYGIRKVGGKAVVLNRDLHSPRGVVWDGDNTVYIADTGGNAIYSMPCGHLAENQPIERLVQVHGPFGLALIKSTDPAFAQVLDGKIVPTATASPGQAGSWWTTLTSWIR